MQQGRYSACRSRPRRLYEIYLFLRNAEQPIDAFDMHVRRSTTWLTANDGWKCSRSAGRKVASRWQCHNATSVVDLRSGLSVPRILYKAAVASVPAAAGGGANDVLPRGSVSVSTRSLYVCSAAGDAKCSKTKESPKC